MKLKHAILNCWIIWGLACLSMVKTDCQLNYPDDIEKTPIYTKYFGFYSLDLPYTRQHIELKNGETIMVKCRTMFA